MRTLVALLVLSLSAETASASGKKKPAAPLPEKGRAVVAIAPIEGVRIELPDNQSYDFGEGFKARLTTHLTESGRYVVVDPLRARVRGVPDYQWNAGYAPAATLRLHVEALNFRTGARGGRMFYGFDERSRNAFNDGSGKLANEFPLDAHAAGGVTWFGQAFQRKGDALFGSRSGLDLGDGFNLNVLFAWLNVKYAFYQSELRLRLELDAPLAGRHESREISVRGRGYFYDVAAGYGPWEAGLKIARRTAMLEAFNRAFAGALAAIERGVGELPLTAVVDDVLDDGAILLGTGLKAQVPVGTIYASVDDPSLRVRVEASFISGSKASLLSGSGVRAGMFFKESSGPGTESLAPSVPGLKAASRTLVASEQIELPSKNLPRPDVDRLTGNVSWLEAFWRSLTELFTLPYRIWRYSQYDQAFHKGPDVLVDGSESDEPVAPIEAVPAPAGPEPVVAVIDSGVDYNHPAIHSRLWLNPSPVADPLGRQDRYGWDFISGDSRPFDDGYHGTEVASAVLSIAPDARIMPLKVFNPWGVTHSAALLAAFRYAVDHGADVIVCAWATSRRSRALDEGVAYAQAHGIPVVAAAGDFGRNLGLVPSYPATLPGVISVAAVDAYDQLLKTSNFGAAIATHGERIRVADPRNQWDRASGTGVAAARVAGALAREVAIVGREAAAQRVFAQAEALPSGTLLLRIEVPGGFDP